jgi:hypothetical protein
MDRQGLFGGVAGEDWQLRQIDHLFAPESEARSRGEVVKRGSLLITERSRSKLLVRSLVRGCSHRKQR